jgi:hypothetical protein
MDVTQACELINNSNITFMPGWTFAAVPHTNRFERAVKVRATYAVKDTDVEWAPDYNNSIVVYGDFPIIVDDCPDPNTLYFKIFMCVIMRIQFHEAREYFSVNTASGNYTDKPFHAHTWNGMNTFNEMIQRHVPGLAPFIGGDVWADMAFGKA